MVLLEAGQPAHTTHYGPHAFHGNIPGGWYKLNVWLTYSGADTVDLTVYLKVGDWDELCNSTRQIASWTSVPVYPGLNEYTYLSDAQVDPHFLFEERIWLEFWPGRDMLLHFGEDHPSNLNLPTPIVPDEWVWWGACCDPDDECEFVRVENCSYQWNEKLECEPNNPCETVPTNESTWGNVKAMYRFP
jgi:hypothetical protein